MLRLSAFRITIGWRSQRCRGVSVPLAGVGLCSSAVYSEDEDRPRDDTSEQTQTDTHHCLNCTVPVAGSIRCRIEPGPDGKRFDPGTGASSSLLPSPGPEFRMPAGAHPLLSRFAGKLRVTNCVSQISQPLLRQLHDSIADAAGPVVKIQRRSGKDAAAGECLFLAIGQPVRAKRSKALVDGIFQIPIVTHR